MPSELRSIVRVTMVLADNGGGDSGIQERAVSDFVGIALMVFVTLAMAIVLGAFVLYGP